MDGFSFPETFHFYKTNIMKKDEVKSNKDLLNKIILGRKYGMTALLIFNILEKNENTKFKYSNKMLKKKDFICK